MLGSFSKIGVLALAALGASPLAASTTKKADPPPFTLCVSERGAREGTTIRSLIVVRGVYRQLDPDKRSELKEALSESVGRREARLNPLVDDLEDGDPDARLDRLFDEAPQTFGAARMLLRNRYCAADGFCVRATSGTCASDEHAPQAREIGRARFLAWPYGYARRVRGYSAEALRRNGDAALVLDGSDTTDAAEREVLALVERREALIRLEEAGSDAEEEAAPPLPWSPEADEVLVIPTLDVVASAIARENAFTR